MRDVKKAKGLLTVKEIAHCVGIDPFTVYRKLWRHEIKALKKGRRWLIPAHKIKKIK
jgi:excisionase family DNA binding protein